MHKYCKSCALQIRVLSSIEIVESHDVRPQNDWVSARCDVRLGRSLSCYRDVLLTGTSQISFHGQDSSAKRQKQHC